MFSIQNTVSRFCARSSGNPCVFFMIAAIAAATGCATEKQMQRSGSETERPAVETMAEASPAAAVIEDEAEKWFALAAEQTDAQIAVNWYILAAARGHVLAQRTLGWIYAEGMGVPQDDFEAVKWYLRAAESGDPEACFDSGWMYLHGRGVAKSDAEAAQWFRRAGERGNLRAQGYLGWMYQEGRGVPQNNQEAFRWLHMAAEQGSSVAQYHLGIMYAQGRGVPQDKQEAQKWLQRAALQAREEARKVSQRGLLPIRSAAD